MEAGSTCTFTAGVEEDAERFRAKCAAVVLTKCLAGGCPLKPPCYSSACFFSAKVRMKDIGNVESSWVLECQNVVFA